MSYYQGRAGDYYRAGGFSFKKLRKWMKKTVVGKLIGGAVSTFIPGGKVAMKALDVLGSPGPGGNPAGAKTAAMEKTYTMAEVRALVARMTGRSM